MSKILNEFRDALAATGVLQPVSQSCKGGKLEVLCRQIPGQETQWLNTIDTILHLSDSLPDFDKMIHICRRYMLKDSQMVFGWHIGISANTTKQLIETVSLIIPILEKTKPTLTPVFRDPGFLPHYQTLKVADPIPNPTISSSSIQTTSAPTIRVIRNDVDEEGKRHVIQEMPLPHVYQELNVPNSKGRGAERTTARTHRNS